MTDLSTIREALAATNLAPLAIRLRKHRDLVEVQGVIEIKLGNLDAAKPAEADLIASAPAWLAELVDRVEAAAAIYRAHECAEAFPTNTFDCFIVHGGHCAKVGTCRACGEAMPCATTKALEVQA